MQSGAEVAEEGKEIQAVNEVKEEDSATNPSGGNPHELSLSLRYASPASFSSAASIW